MEYALYILEKFSKKLSFKKYEDLLKNPVKEIKRIYNYLKKFLKDLD